MSEASLADCIPLWRILRDEGVTALVTPALDYVGALSLGCVDARFFSDAQLEGLGEALRSLVGGLDDGCTLHFLYRVTTDVSADLAAYARQSAGAVEGRGEALTAALNSYVAARVAWLQSQPLRTVRLFLFYSAQSGQPFLARGALGLRLVPASLERLSEDAHRARLKSLAVLRNALQTRLGLAGLSSSELTVPELQQLHRELLNPASCALACGPLAGPLIGSARCGTGTEKQVELRDNLWDARTVTAVGAHLAEYTEAESLLTQDLVEARGHLRQEQTLRRALTLKVLPEGGTHCFNAEPLLALAERPRGADERQTRGADEQPRQEAAGERASTRQEAAGERAGDSLPFPYWLAVTVHLEAQGRSRWMLSTQHGLVDALKGAIPFLADTSVASQARDAAQQRGIQGLFEELNAMSSKLATLSVTLLLDARSLEQLDARTEAARGAFARAGNSALLLEEVSQLPAFLSVLPGAGRYQLRKKACTSRNAADFLPVFAPWSGTARATSLLSTPERDVFRLDLFDRTLAAAHHGLVVADTGSGKSVSLGALTLDALAAGSDAILIDNGNSWEPLTQLLGGVHVPVDIRTPITPFLPWTNMTTPGDPAELDPEALQDVVAYLELCVREEGERGFDKLTVQLVAKAVRRAYEGRFRQAPEERPLMSAFRDALEALAGECVHADDRRICEAVHRRLSLFVGDALYGTFLDRPSALRFDAPLLTFDMAGVSRSPITRSIAMATVMQAVSARAATQAHRRGSAVSMGARRPPTLCVVDEGHAYLGQDETAERFLARCYRTMRKFDVAMWMISQRFGDFLEAKCGDAIIGNSALKLFLRHGSGHDAVSRYFKLSPRADAAFRALSMRRGHHSDFFLLYGERQATVRLALHPLAYWILTTDPADKALIARALEKNPRLSRLQVLEHLARELPHGAR